MKKQNGFIQIPILVIIVALVAISGGFGYLIARKQLTTTNQRTTSPMEVKVASTSDSKVINSSTTVVKSEPNLVKVTPTKIDQNLVYTTKVGIKIPYPKSYSYHVLARGDFNNECTRIGVGMVNGELYNCQDKDYKPNIGTEQIKFGFKNELETVNIWTSDTSMYRENVCETLKGNWSYTVKDIGNYKIYHISSPTGWEDYCLTTPKYNFMLRRNISSNDQIDVGKIVFP